MDFKKKKVDVAIFALLIVALISALLILGKDKIFTSAVDNNVHLEVVRVDADKNFILVKGAIPGAKGSVVTLKEAVKASK